MKRLSFLSLLVIAFILGNIGRYASFFYTGPNPLVLLHITSPTPTPEVNSSYYDFGIVEAVDTKWNKFVYEKIGFSINFPKQFYYKYADCNPKYYYFATTETHGLPGTSTAYITSDYLYDYKQESWNREKMHLVLNKSDTCNVIMSYPQFIEDNNSTYLQGWKIESREISNDAELLAYVQGRYGVSCTLGEKKPSNQIGVYDVVILGCLPSDEVVLKYSPSKNRAISFIVGDKHTFSLQPGWVGFEQPNKPFWADQIMIDSLRFL